MIDVSIDTDKTHVMVGLKDTAWKKYHLAISEDKVLEAVEWLGIIVRIVEKQ